MKTFFVVSLIVVSAFANMSFLGSSDKLKAKLSEIDQSEFGKNLLDTIALQVTSNAPMKDIANLIRDMMNDLRRQQNDADNAHSIKTQECAEQIKHFNNRISHATSEIQEATGAIKSLRKRRRTLEKDIETGKKMLQMLDEEEKAARAKREKDSVDFFARQEQTKLVLDALEVIIPKLKAITPHTAAETFMELAKLGAANPIAALVEVASSLDGEALAKCIRLLEELQVDFAEFLEDDTENEIQAQVNHDNLLAEISALRKSTKDKLASDETELEEVQMALKNQKRRLKENSQELENANKGLDAKTTECNLYDDSYQRDTASRQGELDILEQVAQIVASRLSGLNDYVARR